MAGTLRRHASIDGASVISGRKTTYLKAVWQDCSFPNKKLAFIGRLVCSTCQAGDGRGRRSFAKQPSSILSLPPAGVFWCIARCGHVLLMCDSLCPALANVRTAACMYLFFCLFSARGLANVRTVAYMFLFGCGRCVVPVAAVVALLAGKKSC